MARRVTRTEKFLRKGTRTYTRLRREAIRRGKRLRRGAISWGKRVQRGAKQTYRAYRREGVRAARLRGQMGRVGGRISAMEERMAASAASVKILRDTGTLQKALGIGTTGNYVRYKPRSVEYGFGESRHNDDAGLTIRKLAIIHDQGEGHVPARPILVVPNGETTRALFNIVKRGTERLMRRASATMRARR